MILLLFSTVLMIVIFLCLYVNIKIINKKIELEKNLLTMQKQGLEAVNKEHLSISEELSEMYKDFTMVTKLKNQKQNIKDKSRRGG